MLTYCGTSCNGTTAACNSVHTNDTPAVFLSSQTTPQTNSNPTVTSRCTVLEVQSKARNVYVVCTGRSYPPRAVPAGTSNLPLLPLARDDSRLVVYHLHLAPRRYGRVFDLFGIAHVGVTAQGCAFTQYGRVCGLFRSAHVGVIAQGCTSERKIKSFNSFSAQGSVSSHMPESSHPCAIKIKVRNHLKIDRTGVRRLAQLRYDFSKQPSFEYSTQPALEISLRPCGHVACCTFFINTEERA